MRAIEILQHHLAEGIRPMHQARQRALWRAVGALLRGGKLWLSALGRSIPGEVTDKNGIKAMDRLLGNDRLAGELQLVYRAIASFLLRACWSPVIIVDIVKVRPHIYAITASFAFDGRGLPVYAMVRSQKYIYTPRCHRLFLQELRTVLPEGVRPVLITDAGFRPAWFVEVEKMGWHYVGRVRHNTLFLDGNEWLNCQDLHRRAFARAKNLGMLAFPYASPKKRRVVLAQRRKSKGRRRLNTQGKLGTRKVDARCTTAAREPWLLATTLTCNAEQVVALYRMRMQIEENYRDTKNHRWGWSLDQTASRSHARIEILLLVAALANLVQQSVGCAGEALGLQYRFQANTVRSRRVISLFVLGRFLLARGTRLLTNKDIRAGFLRFPSEIQRIASLAT